MNNQRAFRRRLTAGQKAFLAVLKISARLQLDLSYQWVAPAHYTSRMAQIRISLHAAATSARRRPV
jgi:hypothetical protein